MRQLVLAAGLSLSLTGSLAAQGRYSLALGATWSAPIVTDHIFQTIDLQAAIAPTLTLGASWPVSAKARVGGEVSFATGHLNTKENGQSSNIGTLRTLTVTGAAEGPIAKGVWWRAGGGLVKYLPADDRGVFQDGGPLRWILGLGADYRWQWKPGWQWVAGIRYDFHRFTSDALAAQGFGGTQDVHRIMLSVGIARTP